MTDPLNPLSDEHLKQINAAIAAGENSQLAINKARSAGLNMDEPEKQLQTSLAQLRAIKAVYFPGR